MTLFQLQVILSNCKFSPVKCLDVRKCPWLAQRVSQLSTIPIRVVDFCRILADSLSRAGRRGGNAEEVARGKVSAHPPRWPAVEGKATEA